MSQANTGSLRLLKILLHLAFFISGIATILIGQVLPILSERLALDDSQSGFFFIAQFSGSLGGTFLTKWFGQKKRFLRATLIGCFLMAGGIAALNFDSYLLCLAGFFVNGFGIGLTLPSVNMLTYEINPLNASAALNILNFFWGVGAILSQPFVDLLSRGTNIFTTTAILAAMFILVGAALFLIPPEIENGAIAIADDADESFREPIWTNPIAWLIAFFNFVHVGFESGMGGWLKTYSQRLAGENASFNFLPPILLYFLFFVAGRGVAPVFFRFLDENKMLLLSLLVILAGMCVLLFAADLKFLSLGAAIAGFGTSTVFPTNVSRFTKTFGATAARRATPFFICGTLGAAFTTWTIGYVSKIYENNLRAGMFVLLLSAVILIGMQIFLMLSKSRKAILNEN